VRAIFFLVSLYFAPIPEDRRFFRFADFERRFCLRDFRVRLRRVRLIRFLVFCSSQRRSNEKVDKDDFEDEVKDEFVRVTDAIKYMTLKTEVRKYLMCHKYEIKYHSPSEFIAWWKDSRREDPGSNMMMDFKKDGSNFDPSLLGVFPLFRDHPPSAPAELQCRND